MRKRKFIFSDEFFLDELRQRLRRMKRNTALWQLLQDELRDWVVWKYKPRGKPFPKGKDNPKSKEHIDNTNT